MNVRTNTVEATATISFAKVTGLIKFGMIPGGGFAAGIMLGSIPGKSEEAIMKQ